MAKASAEGDYTGKKPTASAGKRMDEAKDQRMFAAVLAQIHLGIAMARAKGVVCGSPQNIRVIKVKT